MQSPCRLFLLLVFSLGMIGRALAAQGATGTADADFEKLPRDYIAGYLAARPLQGVALGLHDYDGKIGDYSRLAIDAEIERLHRFDTELSKIDPVTLSKSADIDRRILLAAIAGQLFLIEEMGIFEKNPMIYARAIDVNIY